jgi:regulator of sirC expression with transglutaminase-like and TPR domain
VLKTILFLRQRSLILARQGDKKGAIETANYLLLLLKPQAILIIRRRQ